MRLLDQWRWRRTQKKRQSLFEKAYALGFVAGDPEYWRQNKATPSEWLHLLDVVESKAKK